MFRIIKVVIGVPLSCLEASKFTSFGTLFAWYGLKPPPPLRRSFVLVSSFTFTTGEDSDGDNSADDAVVERVLIRPGVTGSLIGVGNVNRRALSSMQLGRLFISFA